MIKLGNINKTYHSKASSFQALYDVSLHVDEGEMVAIMGRSGCGKTTLLNIMGLMDRMDSGSYHLDGVDAQKVSAYDASLLRNQKIGFIYQTFNLITDFTSFENVEMPMGYAGVPRKERRVRAEQLLSSVGLSEKMRNKPGELSGGERQRVAIARALVNSPKVILADEPTGNLDEKNGSDILELLRKLNDDGVTIVLVTHDEAIARSANRIVRMADGRII